MGRTLVSKNSAWSGGSGLGSSARVPLGRPNERHNTSAALPTETHVRVAEERGVWVSALVGVGGWGGMSPSGPRSAARPRVSLSSEQLLDHAAGHVGKPEVPAGVAVGHPGVVDPE